MNQSTLDQTASQLKLGKVRYEEKVTSTNDLAAEWAAQGAPHLSLIAADHQNAGRGRGGRVWYTPPDSALAFSLLLRPDAAPEDLGRFSGLGALAVCAALQDLGLDPRIKWPNDVLLAGKKVCGVLPEAIWMGSTLQAVILGIGVNLKSTAYPKDIPLLFPATSVEEVLERPVEPAGFLQAVLAQLITWYDRINSAAFIDAWERNLAFLGDVVEIIQGEQASSSGRLAGLDKTGRLVLEVSGAGRQAFSASEIHLRPKVDSPGNSTTLNPEAEEQTDE